MPLQYCSITGADDAVDGNDLNALAKEFPFVEWAILASPENFGKSRFPTEKWIRNFREQYQGHHFGMHLCTQALINFSKGEKSVLALMEGFKRVQLNLKFGNVEGKYDPVELLARIKENPRWQFIIQYTPDKKFLLPLLGDIPNHAILFDGSIGRGVSPESWPAPIPGHFCGYAGGLNPDNVGQNLEIISKVIPANYVTWIDMETGVRTNDVFDLAKVRSVLKTAAPYVILAQQSPTLKAAQ